MELKQYLESLDSYNGLNMKKGLIKQIKDQTFFLSEDALLPQRIWHIINQTQQIPLCPVCHTQLKWSKWRKKYYTACSKSCLNKFEGFQEKCKNGIKQKYGIDNAMHADQFKQKQKHTVQQRHGVDNVSRNKIIQEQKKQNYLKKHGVDNPRKNETVKQSIKETNIRLFDRENAKQTHISKVSLEILSNKEKLKHLHHENKFTLKEIAHRLGVDVTTVSRRFQMLDIEVLNVSPKTSFQELQIQQFIQQNYHNQIITNTRKIIPPYELDIYIPEHNLAIEYCGLYWHSNKFINKWYHYNKMKMCNDKGIRLITVFEDEWIYKTEQVKQKILYILKQLSAKTTYARNTKISYIDYATAKPFLDAYHIQGSVGNVSPTISLGLFDKEDLVAVCTITKRKDYYDITRYATSKKVVGGFGKILNYLQKQLQLPKIVTFADLRWSEGDLYYKLGFEYNKFLPPDYSYIEGDKRVHKFNYRHKYLKNKLPNYDPSLSETQNTLNHNVYRIYNCGLIKFQICQ